VRAACDPERSFGAEQPGSRFPSQAGLGSAPPKEPLRPTNIRETLAQMQGLFASRKRALPPVSPVADTWPAAAGRDEGAKENASKRSSRESTRRSRPDDVDLSDDGAAASGGAPRR
jgi:hypothetical protein